MEPEGTLMFGTGDVTEVVGVLQFLCIVLLSSPSTSSSISFLVPFLVPVLSLLLLNY